VPGLRSQHARLTVCQTTVLGPLYAGYCLLDCCEENISDGVVLYLCHVAWTKCTPRSGTFVFFLHGCMAATPICRYIIVLHVG